MDQGNLRISRRLGHPGWALAIGEKCGCAVAFRLVNGGIGRAVDDGSKALPLEKGAYAFGGAKIKFCAWRRMNMAILNRKDGGEGKSVAGRVRSGGRRI